MGKDRRLSRILGGDGKSVTLALDGFGFSTKTAGIDTAAKLVPAMAEHGLDNVLVTYGQATRFASHFQDVGMCLRVDVNAALFDASVPDIIPTFTVEDALRIGADGVVMMAFPGSPSEIETTKHSIRLATDAARWGMPFISESLPYGYPVTTDESNHPDSMAAAARYGEELGADIIKTRYTGGEDDALIARNCTVPVLALGGPKGERSTYFGFVEHVMKSGASGVAVGRNVTQDDNPLGMVAALAALVHEGATADKASEIYESTRSS